MYLKPVLFYLPLRPKSIWAKIFRIWLFIDVAVANVFICEFRGHEFKAH